MKKLLIVLNLLIIMVIGYANAGGGDGVLASDDSGMVLSGDSQYVATTVTYKLDANSFTKAYKADKIKPFLYQIKCDYSTLYQKLLGLKSTKKIQSVTFEDGDYSIILDAVNCNIYANKINIVDYNKPADKDKVLTVAKSFVSKSEIIKGFNMKFADPEIYSNVSPVVYNTLSTDATDNTGLQDDYVDNNDPNAGASLSSSTITTYQVVFPLLLNGKKIYDFRGDMVGLYLTINGNNEVTNYYVNYVAGMKLVKRTADKMDLKGIIDFAGQGAKNPYYSYDNTLKSLEIRMSGAERIIQLMNVYDPNTQQYSNYLSSGWRFKSDAELKNYDNTLSYYYQTVSDFKVVNGTY